MPPALLLAFALAAIIASAAIGARRLGVPHSILLVLVGVVLAFIPGLPRVGLNPDLVLLLFLPPLLYTSGVGMSWRGFRANLAPIMLLAVGCVLFTAAAVAGAAHWLFAMPWALAAVLGRRRLAARCGGAHGHRQAPGRARAHPDHSGGRRPGQRCHRADPVQLRGGGREHRGWRSDRPRRAHLRADCGRRAGLGCGGRLGSVAVAPLGRRAIWWRS